MQLNGQLQDDAFLHCWCLQCAVIILVSGVGIRFGTLSSGRWWGASVWIRLRNRWNRKKTHNFLNCVSKYGYTHNSKTKCINNGLALTSARPCGQSVPVLRDRGGPRIRQHGDSREHSVQTSSHLPSAHRSTSKYTAALYTYDQYYDHNTSASLDKSHSEVDLRTSTTENILLHISMHRYMFA